MPLDTMFYLVSDRVRVSSSYNDHSFVRHWGYQSREERVWVSFFGRLECSCPTFLFMQHTKSFRFLSKKM